MTLDCSHDGFPVRILEAMIRQGRIEDLFHFVEVCTADLQVAVKLLQPFTTV